MYIWGDPSTEAFGTEEDRLSWTLPSCLISQSRWSDHKTGNPSDCGKPTTAEGFKELLVLTQEEKSREQVY